MNVNIEEIKQEFEGMSIKELEENLKKVTELYNKLEKIDQGIESIGDENE